jgi:hypothetical protein
MTDTMTIAKTILAQLGNRKFIAMTGAKDLIALESGLQFGIGKGASQKINKVRITLNCKDLYDVEYFNIRGCNVKLIVKHEDIYAEDLASTFEDVTGFLTSL